LTTFDTVGVETPVRRAMAASVGLGAEEARLTAILASKCFVAISLAAGVCAVKAPRNLTRT
jgi:hypothetical protein